MILKYTPAQIIAALIREKGIGGMPGEKNVQWPVFAAPLPDTPDNAISIRNNATPTKGRIQRTGESIFQPGISVRVRDTRNDSAQDKANEIAALFETVHRVQIIVKDKVYRIDGIHLTTSPVDTGQDPLRRHVFSSDYITTICEIEP